MFYAAATLTSLLLALAAADSPLWFVVPKLMLGAIALGVMWWVSVAATGVLGGAFKERPVPPGKIAFAVAVPLWIVAVIADGGARSWVFAVPASVAGLLAWAGGLWWLWGWYADAREEEQGEDGVDSGEGDDDYEG